MPKRLYPIFREAAEYTLVPHLKNILFACADGKLPKGLSLSKGIIYINKNNKCFKYEMPEEPQKVLILCKLIFEQILEMRPEEQKKQNLDEYEQYKAQTTIDLSREINTIKDVRKKEDKLKLIDEYVLRVGQDLGMNLKQKQRLKYAIMAGLDLKLIQGIKFDESKISEIPNLLVKKGKTGFIIKITKEK
jgi:hypothetical protein